MRKCLASATYEIAIIGKIPNGITNIRRLTTSKAVHGMPIEKANNQIASIGNSAKDGVWTLETAVNSALARVHLR